MADDVPGCRCAYQPCSTLRLVFRNFERVCRLLRWQGQLGHHRSGAGRGTRVEDRGQWTYCSSTWRSGTRPHRSRRRDAQGVPAAPWWVPAAQPAQRLQPGGTYWCCWEPRRRSGNWVRPLPNAEVISSRVLPRLPPPHEFKEFVAGWHWLSRRNLPRSWSASVQDESLNRYLAVKRRSRAKQCAWTPPGGSAPLAWSAQTGRPTRRR